MGLHKLRSQCTVWVLYAKEDIRICVYIYIYIHPPYRCRHLHISDPGLRIREPPMRLPYVVHDLRPTWKVHRDLRQSASFFLALG